MDPARLEFIAGSAERIKGGFLDQRAVGVGDHARRPQVVLVVIRDTQHRVRNRKLHLLGRVNIDRIARRERRRKITDGSEVVGQSAQPVAGGGIKFPHAHARRQLQRFAGRVQVHQF